MKTIIGGPYTQGGMDDLSDKKLVLLIEDNEKLNIANRRALALRGYEVLASSTLAGGQLHLAKIEPDVILLDIELPDGDGISFCNEIRETTTAHILFLTANTKHESMMQALQYGGDDYITKPFHPEELIARIDAVMRRRKMDKATTKTIIKGALTLDIVATQGFIAGNNLALTPKEFSLLLLLVQNENKILSAEYVYAEVWKAPLVGDKNSMQAIISKVRQKIEYSGYYIDSIRGQGYVFRLK